MAAAVADEFMDDTALQQLRRFIVQGYLKIEPATSKEVQNDARSIRAKILSCPMDVPNPLYHSLKSPSGDAAGNNLLHVAHSEMIGKSFLDSPELVDTCPICWVWNIECTLTPGLTCGIKVRKQPCGT